MQLQQDRRDKRTSGEGNRGMVLLGVALLLLAGVGSRLGYLQLVRGSYHRELAENNRIRLIPIRPPRGRILDRYGRVLATNRLSYSVFLEPMQLRARQWPEVLGRLSGFIAVPADRMAQKLRIAGYNSPYPVRVLQNVEPKLVTVLREHIQQLPGIRVDVEWMRTYPNGPIASHLLGYTGEISEQQLAERKEQGYRLGDIVGKAGVERLLEEQLHGEWGGEPVEVDGAGQVVRVLGERPPKAGADVRLSIDLSLQKAAESALHSLQKRGAVVALDPRTGQVLAMASSPSYDANILSGRIATADWKRLQTPERPLLNRALRPYPTASTFKIIMTAAALESGKFNPASTLQTFGGLRIGSRVFREHDGGGFGRLGFVGALAISSDTFFYQVGLRIGPEQIGHWARNFGFGTRTGLGLPSESNGIVPTPEWKMQRFGQRWYPGDTANTSIGQGMVLSTPLQNAIMVSAIANGGYRVQPHLQLDSRPGLSPVGLAPATLNTIRLGLIEVVRGGTARRSLGNIGIPNAGKTGSAEHGLRKARQTHAVFVGYAPILQPQIAVSVFLENGGHGGSDAAPIAKKIYKAYFSHGTKKSASTSTKHVE
ncbi:penicillin-binding protein 2 [Gloeobacter kilaueensis]|uniref:Penicillin-binding protein 2 n=1 Tax=Gloeobacter kilaueensis (strain ATCC BAA-2537 / CCAP 1431/1 / ULC 316 / JS1) TaxID=1183438 RepID=U5QL50_GLOK1|nr:penicillin-binding protein 2 [Gloeobacter kilaueensis]AGY58385.1 penicillin-binding protein 2 [Gloeobacter kilaueensis JS1]